MNEISKLENEVGKVDVKILKIIRRIKPELIEGIEVYTQGGDEDEEIEEGEGELMIEGEARQEAQTVFVDHLAAGFTDYIRNIIALTASFKWSVIVEWKRTEENFTHEDQELQVLVAAEGAIRQIFELNFKVNKPSK